MGNRVTSHSRLRFDFPLGRHKTEDASLVTKPDAPGPLTRAQMVELLWRAKKIHLTGSIDYEYQPNPHLAPITGSVAVNVILIRQESNTASDENDVFRQLMGDRTLYQAPFANWTSLEGEADVGTGFMEVTPVIHGLQVDEDGYWLNPYALGQGAEPQPFTLFGTNTEEISWEAGGDEEIGFWPAGSDAIVLRILAVNENAAPNALVAATLNLHGTAVNFPLSVGGSYSSIDSPDVSFSGDTATIEIIEWFPYATTTAAAAWDATTGAPINGGPGA